MLEGNIITRVLITGKQGDQRDTKKEREREKGRSRGRRGEKMLHCGFDDEGRGLKSRNVGSLWKPGKARNCIFPLSLKKECRLADTSVIPVERFWTSDLQNCTIIHLVGFKPMSLWYNLTAATGN